MNEFDIGFQYLFQPGPGVRSGLSDLSYPNTGPARGRRYAYLSFYFPPVFPLEQVNYNQQHQQVNDGPGADSLAFKFYGFSQVNHEIHQVAYRLLVAFIPVGFRLVGRFGNDLQVVNLPL